MVDTDSRTGFIDNVTTHHFLGSISPLTCVFTTVISPSHAGSMNCPAHKAALAHRCVGAAGRKASQKPKHGQRGPGRGGQEGRVGKEARTCFVGRQSGAAGWQRYSKAVDSR
jgi:hypothetical protein